MNERHQMRAQQILEQLTSLNEELSAGDVIPHQIVISDRPDEIVVGANEEGLIYLAKEALGLALCRTRGAHVHLDEHGLVDRCDKPLVLTRHLKLWSENGDA